MTEDIDQRLQPPSSYTMFRRKLDILQNQCKSKILNISQP